MKQIQLTRGLVTLVDDSDYEFLMQWKWCANKCGHAYYASRGYWQDGKLCTIRMHRLLTCAIRGMDVDHIDGDGLNNQRTNLRVCTRSENSWNRGGKRVSTSAYCGVSWASRDKRWQAVIMVNRKRMYLGYYTSEIEAALAYNEAAKKHHGDFARLNVIPTL